MTSAAHKILLLLEVASQQLAPLEIAQNLKLNRNTVRARLSELRRRGDVHRVAPGKYSISPTYGVGFKQPPRIQNLRVTTFGIPVVRGETVVRELPGNDAHGDDGLRIRIQFGKKRGIISYTVKAPRGLDPYGLRLCHKIVEMETWLRGYQDLDWWARNFEFLWDTHSIRLEGVTAVTFYDLAGTVEKYYNKGTGMRREVRSSSPARIQDLEALIQGGITSHQALQGLNVLRGEVQQLTDAMKGIWYQYRDMLEMFKADHEAVKRLIDIVEDRHDRDNTGQVGQP